jgi:hypothetical protein
MWTMMIACTKLAVLLLITTASAQVHHNQGPTDIAVGISWAALGGSDPLPYASLGVNVAVDPIVVHLSGVHLSATAMPTLSFGAETNGSPRLDHVQIPVGIRLRVADERPDGVAAIDGSVAGGMMLTAGRFNTSGADLRAFMSFDVGLGIFHRSGIRLRALMSIGHYGGEDGRDVQYGGLYLVIASTGW